MRAHFEAVLPEFNTKNEKFSPTNRLYQGVPSIAISRGGRIFLGWCSGGDCEPRMENYDVVHYSDDGGKTWRDTPVFFVVSDKEKMVHVFDVQLWVDEDGKLHAYWIQDCVEKVKPGQKNEWTPDNPVVVGDYVYSDLEHSTWEVVCNDPDADELVFSEPRYVCPGFLRCNPLKTKSGKLFVFAYNQLSDRYTFSLLRDGGADFERVKGGKKIRTPFDEGMAYEVSPGVIRFMARTWSDGIAESYSFDDGESWTDGKPSGITAPSSRFFVSRTPSGRVMLVHNDHEKIRTNMTVKLSEDDGKTWKYSLLIDDRCEISYPDADFYNGKIYLTYDFGRCKENEILLAEFTEDDIINGVKPKINTISKPKITSI